MLDNANGQSNPGNTNRKKLYNFDQVFGMQQNQDDIYSGLGISNLINKVVEGYHATIFAYGQTGSGKSFTMEGNEREVEKLGDIARQNLEVQDGIIQKSVKDLFSKVNQLKESDKTRHFNVFCSFL